MFALEGRGPVRKYLLPYRFRIREDAEEAARRINGKFSEPQVWVVELDQFGEQKKEGERCWRP